jgi:hypothetical protein
LDIVLPEPKAFMEPLPVETEPVIEVSGVPAIPSVQSEIAKALPIAAAPIARIGAPPSARNVSILRKSALFGGMAIGLAAAVWLGIHVLQSRPQVAAPVVDAKPEAHAPASNALELKQRNALNSANKLIAANDLNGAQQALQQAAALNGPLTSEIVKKQSEVEGSLQDANLRQLRQAEEKLWQRATSRIAEGRFAEAQKDFRQVLTLPLGGVHREDAQNYLDKIIPQRVQQNSLTNQAQQALRVSDFQSARKAASQLREVGGDRAGVLAEIERQEQAKLAQLVSQFNQLKQRGDDDAVQQLKTLQPKFQALAGDGGPQSAEAANYANAVPGAITEMQASIQKKTADAAFQRIVQRYQQAASTNDKNGLASARSEFQSVIQSGGSHADEAHKYRTEIDDKVAALSESAMHAAAPSLKNDVPNPVAANNNENELRAVIQRYAQAFEKKDADALRQVWPGMGSKYARYKQIFELASSIREQVGIESVAVSADGTSAVVKSSVSQSYTPKADKTKPQQFTREFVFNLEKTSRGTWVISDVQ